MDSEQRVVSRCFNLKRRAFHKYIRETGGALKMRGINFCRAITMALCSVITSPTETHSNGPFRNRWEWGPVYYRSQCRPLVGYMTTVYIEVGFGPYQLLNYGSYLSGGEGNA